MRYECQNCGEIIDSGDIVKNDDNVPHCPECKSTNVEVREGDSEYGN